MTFVRDNVLFKNVCPSAFYNIRCENCGIVMVKVKFTFEGEVKFNYKCKKCDYEGHAEGKLSIEDEN